MWFKNKSPRRQDNVTGKEVIVKSPGCEEEGHNLEVKLLMDSENHIKFGIQMESDILKVKLLNLLKLKIWLKQQRL